jgi:hypothetical protein
MAQLRAGTVVVKTLDQEALTSLVRDGLAEISGGRAHLPGSCEGARGPRP